jgi:hypothetical protein
VEVELAQQVDTSHDLAELVGLIAHADQPGAASLANNSQ